MNNKIYMTYEMIVYILYTNFSAHIMLPVCISFPGLLPEISSWGSCFLEKTNSPIFIILHLPVVLCLGMEPHEILTPAPC